MGSGEPLGVGLGPVETAGHLLAKIREGNAYARARKRRFRGASSVLKLVTLGLSAASTVILGLQNLDFWAGLAFALVAVVTLLGAVEGFFNWRARWVLMEETQYRFQRLADELEYLVVSTPAGELTHDQLRPLFEQYQGVWAQLSDRWLQERRGPAATAGS
ncbi:hypothetical protein CFP65_6492 [Kitasatospora sp. MMS16-BH015]|uniref:DUF4231 domain-containing protein n=1 Tax=Kitasatospora sp. MMS16-BH015 TaxID=2018025 RepID=UPI000CA1AA68|nr:DUF4231 domain-containing protein [Kitasatospora sp. MMS16-BH015]AUG81146.1 hypothetical protein CFP65_6492 [Kitasatospora sp. MMS16-BH015]